MSFTLISFIMCLRTHTHSLTHSLTKALTDSLIPSSSDWLSVPPPHPPCALSPLGSSLTHSTGFCLVLPLSHSNRARTYARMHARMYARTHARTQTLIAIVVQLFEHFNVIVLYKFIYYDYLLISLLENIHRSQSYTSFG